MVSIEANITTDTCIENLLSKIIAWCFVYH